VLHFHVDLHRDSAPPPPFQLLGAANCSGLQFRACENARAKSAKLQKEERAAWDQMVVWRMGGAVRQRRHGMGVFHPLDVNALHGS
jgi:hypothetical protein